MAHTIPFRRAAVGAAALAAAVAALTAGHAQTHHRADSVWTTYGATSPTSDAPASPAPTVSPADSVWTG